MAVAVDLRDLGSTATAYRCLIRTVNLRVTARGT
jgi:hypothetical protein